jgi:acyl carrier protein
MVPTSWTVLEVLPLTSSGKIDRKALPAPTDGGGGPLDAVFVPPEDGMEREIADIFQGVLGGDGISATADFFELGGNSLAAVRAIGRIRLTITEDVSLRDLFEAPTVAGLSPRLQSMRASPNRHAASTDADRPPDVGDENRGRTENRGLVSAHCPVRLPQENVDLQTMPSGDDGYLQDIFDGGLAMHWIPRWIIQLLAILLVQYAGLAALGPLLALFASVRTAYGLPLGCLLAPLLMELGSFGAFGIVLVLKWVLVGRLRPGCYRMWSVQFLQWWCLSLLFGLITSGLAALQPTAIYNAMLRLLGARIGANVLLNNASITEPDLVTVDNSARVGFGKFGDTYLYMIIVYIYPI